MITNKDVRVEHGNLVLNGDKYPLDGQSPEEIMQIVKDNSDTTPTENSDAPITSGGVFAADKDISDTIGDITQTGITGATVAAQLDALKTGALKVGVITSASVTVNAGWRQFVDIPLTEALPTGTVALFVIETASPASVFGNFATYDRSNKLVKIGVYNTSNEAVTGTYKVAYLYTEGA